MGVFRMISGFYPPPNESVPVLKAYKNSENTPMESQWKPPNPKTPKSLSGYYLTLLNVGLKSVNDCNTTIALDI